MARIGLSKSSEQKRVCDKSLAIEQFRLEPESTDINRIDFYNWCYRDLQIKLQNKTVQASFGEIMSCQDKETSACRLRAHCGAENELTEREHFASAQVY